MPKKAFTKFDDLDEVTMNRVDVMLYAGHSGEKVAAYLQEELGLYTDVKHGSLAKHLRTYRREVLPEKAIEEVAKFNGTFPEYVAVRMKPLQELEKVAATHKGRLLKVLQQEQQMKGGLLMGQVSEALAAYQRSLTELAKLQIELGILQKAPRKVSGVITDEHGNVRTFDWTEEETALLREVESVVSGE